MAEPTIDPLAYNVPIVDHRGYPTPQFIRQWQQLLRELADAKARIAALEAAP